MLTSEKIKSQTPSIPWSWSDGDRALQVCVIVCVCTFAESVAGADETSCSPDSCNHSKKNTWKHTRMRASTHMHLHQ